MTSSRAAPGSGWILADFDDTLAPGDSHAGLLRFILRRRLWPLLLLLPVIALGGLVYLVPACGVREFRLSGGPSPWGSRRWVGASWCGPIATPGPGCFGRPAPC